MAKKVNAEPDEIYVYVGPTVKGVIQSGSIYTGTRQAVLDKYREAIERTPAIGMLIVRDADVAQTRRKIKAGDNALANAYRTILKT